MNLEFLTFFLANIITGTIFFKYKVQHLNKKKDDKLDFLLCKINKLEIEVSDLHETLDLLEDRLHRKHIDMRQSHEQLDNKIDNFIVSNYDITD